MIKSIKREVEEDKIFFVQLENYKVRRYTNI